MTRQPDVPDLGSGGALEHAMLATAFRLLLGSGRPVRPARLAEALASDPERVERILERLDSQGRIRRDQTGAVTGSHGLSVTPTRHELILQPASRQGPGQQRRFWTWCAWDAVGILAALDASGRIRSTSPSSDARIELDFDRGSPRQADPDLVVFFADTDCCTPATNSGGSCGSGSVIDVWCPLVNFFENADAATAWAAEHGARGSAVPLVEAIRQGRAAWRQWIA